MGRSAREDYNRYEFDDLLELLEVTPAIALAAEMQADEAELIDLAGVLSRLGGNFGVLSKQKRMIESEIPTGAAGLRFKTEQSRVANRSFNTQGLLAKFAHHRGENLTDTLLFLIKIGALKLEWKWSALQQAAQVSDVTLVVAKHEIEDGDPDVDVGEVWGWGSVKYSNIEEGN